MKHVLYLIFILSLTSCASSGVSNNQTRIDSIPMYGQPEIERPDFLKKADTDLIRKAEKGFGSREKASKAWYAQGEKFMSEGNLDFAMHRYNQSWLLDPNNYQPYWGFGRVLLEQDKLDEAIKSLEKSKSLINDAYQEVALLADLGTAYAYKGKQDATYFTEANDYFAMSTEMDPKYPNAWARWAYSLYDQGKYSDCWGKVVKYEALTSQPFPESLTKKLAAKFPKP